MAFSLGEDAGEQLLKAAEANLQKFLQQKPEHAFAQVLAASCAFNLANLKERRGDLTAAQESYQHAIDALNEAYRLRVQLVDRLTRLEVEADHALLVEHDFPAAIKLYEEIVQFSEASPVRPALRAHWMLTGIYSGAWQRPQADDSNVNIELARQHLLDILAFWPDSSEATAVRRYILWDPKAGRSRTPYLPIDSQEVGISN